MTEEFISVERARETILDALRVLGPERLLISDALGRRLAEPLRAPWDAPSFDNSAMDGFAFRFDDRASVLRIVGLSAAGTPFEGALAAGQAIRIMTGAAVPPGADTVAMREICVADERELRIDANQAGGRGQHIRTRGSYMSAGDEVMAVGTRIRAADIGLLASFGRTVVYTRRRPRVAIVTTGTELAEPDRALGPGGIHNSNAFMLEALVREAGAIPLVSPIVPDDEDQTRAAIRDIAATVDLVLTVGGVSVGDFDFVRQILEEETGGMAFWKVRVKPGKPLAFGMLREGSVPAIGLPGNPVSSFVAFHLFVRPALDVLQGDAPEDSGPRRAFVRTTAEIHSTARRREYIPGCLNHGAETTFTPYPNLSSGNVLSIQGCDALAVVDEGCEFVEADGSVTVEIL